MLTQDDLDRLARIEDKLDRLLDTKVNITVVPVYPIPDTLPAPPPYQWPGGTITC